MSNLACSTGITSQAELMFPEHLRLAIILETIQKMLELPRSSSVRARGSISLRPAKQFYSSRSLSCGIYTEYLHLCFKRYRL